ncbi:hypothetical protein Tco_0233567 [Tanacetum coccineum]
MVDVLVKQAKPAALRPLLVGITVTLIPDTTTSSPTQPPPTQPKQSKIKRILKKSHNPKSQADDTSLEKQKARLKQIDLSKDVPDFSKIKQENAAKQNMPKHSSTKFNKAALAIYNQKDKLYKMIREFKAYNRHPTHKALFNALAVSLSVDEDDMDKLADPPFQKKRQRDDHDKDPSDDANKESKKKKGRIMMYLPLRKPKISLLHLKVQPHLNLQKLIKLCKQKKQLKILIKRQEWMRNQPIYRGNPLPKKMDKEPAVDEVVNVDDHSQEDSAPCQDKSK